MNNVILLIIVAAFAGGSIAPFAKIALEVFPPFTLTVIRFLSASLVLLPFVIRNKELHPRMLRELLPVAVIGAINPILLFIALQLTLASVSPLIYAAVPLLTALYLHRFRLTKITRDSILGIVVGFTGVAIIILLPFFQNGSVDLKNLWGNLLIFGAAVSFMFYGIISNDKQQELHISPMALTFYLALVTLVMSIPFAAYELTSQPLDITHMELKHVLSSLEIGFLGTSLFYLAYQKAIQQGNELTASLFTYLQPVATILFAVWLLGEKITPAFVIGGTLALIGAGVASVRNHQHARNQIGI